MLAAPVVEPVAFRQVDVAVLVGLAGTGDGGYEHCVTEEELVVGGVGNFIFGVLEKEGA